MSDERPPDDVDLAPLPNRMTRGTLQGCLGIVCVLALPALLVLPLDVWRPPRWVELAVPYVGFGAAGLGAWLLARMPSSDAERTHDPLHPLTRAGMSPLLERPARSTNRLMLVGCVFLVCVAWVGYGLASVAVLLSPVFVAGLVLTGASGGLLSVGGLLVAERRLPYLAWRWERVPISGAHGDQAMPLVLFGLVSLGGALMNAAVVGYEFGAIGLAMLVVVGALVTPFVRRLPRNAAPHDTIRSGYRSGSPPAWPVSDDELP